MYDISEKDSFIVSRDSLLDFMEDIKTVLIAYRLALVSNNHTKLDIAEGMVERTNSWIYDLGDEND